MSHADFVLSKDEAAGVRIFMRRHENVDKTRADAVADFLQQYPRARLAYLDYIVTERSIQVRAKQMNKDLIITLHIEIDSVSHNGKSILL